jgi:hypothetical protein
LVGLKKIISPVEMDPDVYCHAPFRQDDYAEKALGLWIRSNTTEQEKVFVAGDGAKVQAYSERLSPTIYFNATQTEMARQRLFHDLSADHPSMIAVPLFPGYELTVNQDVRSFIRNLIERDYVLDRCMYGYNIYRRRQ